MQLSFFKRNIQKHFDNIASKRRFWKSKNKYYYEDQSAFMKFLIYPDQKILELGCGTGELLDDLKPAYGVGIDISHNMINLCQRSFHDLEFINGDAENPDTWEIKDKFDYIIMSDLVGHLEDIQNTFENLHQFCHDSTKIIVSYYNFLWEPLIKIAEKISWKTPTKLCNWLSPEDISNLLSLSDFEVIKKERRFLFPWEIPFLKHILNFIASLPLINRLCLCHYIVARPIKKDYEKSHKSVSIIIPCKNEKVNIEAAIKRVPDFGASQEIIFVDGHSVDGTQDEIKRVIQAYPDKDIKFLVQDKKGKGDAVRKGFDYASKDILMILDADLTVAPEDLPKFYNAIVLDKGEFINGSRLVYPMENEAMRFLNMLGNKFFSLMFTWLLNQRIKDTLCGTKVISKQNYELIAKNRKYFGDFDPFGDFDLLFGASKLNLKIIEMPARYHARTYGQTQISRFRHGLLLLKMCIFAIRKLKIISKID